MNRKLLSFLPVSLRVLALVCVIPAALSSQGVTGSVTVDFAAVQHVNSASGFLFGTTPTTAPEHLAPLRPRFWRYSDFAWPWPFSPSTIFYSWADLARRFYSIAPDVEAHLMVSNDHGYPVDGWPNGAPWVNWAAYETRLRGIVRMLRDNHLSGTVDVWNEPDIPMFWNGTRAQFHELYLRAYRVIREEMGPDVALGGPTLGTYIHADVEAFLEYCLANGCEVNDLTYHTLDDSPPGIAVIAADARDARTSFLENPRYAPLKIRRIVTNEIVGPRYTHQPAGTLTHYAEFEAGGADLGARSTWSNPEAFAGMLSGLLTAGSLQPRSVWWAHKLYADSVATRVASSVSGPQIVALASRASDTPFPQVLVGHVDYVRSYTREPASLNAQLVLNNITSMPLFNGVRRVTVRIESIPDTGEAALSAPVPLAETAASVYGGTAQIALPPIGVGAVLRVTLVPRDDGYPDPPGNFEASALDNTVSMQWTRPTVGPPATGYLLEVGATPTSFALASIPLGDVTTFVAPAPTGAYYVRLRATNAAGQSTATSARRLDVGCVAPPGPPTALSASVAGGSVTLNWDPAAGNVGRYILEAGSSPGLGNIATAVLAPVTRFSAVAPPGTYFIRVRAGNACGTSVPSAEIFIVIGAAATLPGPPGEPVPAVSGSNVSLAWTAPANGDTPTGYLLEAGTSPGLSNLARVTTGPATSFATSGVGPGTYYVRVRAVNGAGTGPPSADATVVVTGAASEGGR
jgi:hypothetical protein